jgi:hypothetical protein
MTKSLKREQLRLLKLEKRLLAVGAGIAGLTAGGANAKEILGEMTTEHASKVTDAYLGLVQSVQAAHDALNAKAMALGVELLKAGGQPKDRTLDAARQILGL